MGIAVLLSVLVGVAIVVQNGTNAQLMRSTNLWLLLAVGNSLAATTSAVIFMAQRQRAGLVQELGTIPLAVLIPGVCGVIITAGMPSAIGKLGVFNTVLLVIGCQIVASLAWDRFYAGQTTSLTQLVGAGLVAAGVLLILRPGQ